MSTDSINRQILRPIKSTNTRYYVLLAVLLAGLAWFVYAWYVQLTQGLQVTGLRDWGANAGVPWGLYIGAFAWWVGVAHGGIAISAAVRVLKLERFKPIARIAEVLTIAALMMASLAIVFDLGRPDRILNTIIYWPGRVQESPLSWDVAAISVYFILSLTYFVLTLRDDIIAVREQLPAKWAPIYKAITLGYSPDESKEMDRLAWWLAVAVLALVALLSGGVVPWLFGLMGAQPGWFGPFAGPKMLVEALTSAIAIVAVVAAVLRYAYGWQEIIPDAIFQDLGKALIVFGLGTLWIMLHYALTGLYFSPEAVESVTQATLSSFSFQLVVAGVALSTMWFIAQTLQPRLFTVLRTVVASAVLASAIFLEKVLFVVEGLLHPTIPPLSVLYPAGTYTPTWVELSLVAGTLVLVALIFAVVSKIIPLVELEEVGQ